MIPIAEMDAGDAAAIHTLITDVDDTCTTDGALTASAYAALERLKQVGLRVLISTGRPAGWCDHIARMWPVDAVVGENGALGLWYDRERRSLQSLHSLGEAALRENRVRIARVAERVLQEVPGTALASDQFCRLYDLAIDYCEDVPRIGEAGVQQIVRVMEREGMTAKVSSIHVNGWFGDHDKLTMTRTLMQRLYGLSLDQEKSRIAYAGDSPNDAPMFAYFPHSVGVANVRDFIGRIDALPTYVTRERSGSGFAELASMLIAARGARSG